MANPITIFPGGHDDSVVWREIKWLSSCR